MSKNFTSKHFIPLARWMKSSKPAEPSATEARYMSEAHKNVLLGRQAMHEELVNSMAELFKDDNPLFDENKFREAAGYDKLQL